MNFAFPALIILVITLPGIFFRLGYRNGAKNQFHGNNGLGDVSLEIAKGVLFAILIHLLAALVCLPDWFQPVTMPINFDYVFELLGGNNNSPDYQAAVQNISDHSARISAYLILTSLFGIVLGFALRTLVVANFIDVKIGMLRMQNPWEYFFNGGDYAIRSLEDEFGVAKYWELRKALKRKVTCYVSLLIEIPKVDKPEYLINGIVEDYTFNSIGELAFIILEDASRMELTPTSVNILEAISFDPPPEFLKPYNFVKISGGRFTVPFSTVKNMNAAWTFVEEGENPPADSNVKDGKASAPTKGVPQAPPPTTVGDQGNPPPVENPIKPPEIPPGG